MHRNHLLPFSLWLVCAGCSDGGPDLSQVSGTVTLNGNPLENAAVVFSPKTEHPDIGSSRGVTDSSGRYTLHYGSRRVGVFPGKHGVIVEHAEYTDYGLSATVAEGSNTIDFSLRQDPASKRSRRSREIDKSEAFPASP